MTIETIGEAYRLGWRVRVRCAWGKREALKSNLRVHGKRQLTSKHSSGRAARTSPCRRWGTG